MTKEKKKRFYELMHKAIKPMNNQLKQERWEKEFDKEYRKQFPNLSDAPEDIKLAEKLGGKLGTNMQWIKSFVKKNRQEAYWLGIDVMSKECDRALTAQADELVKKLEGIRNEQDSMCTENDRCHPTYCDHRTKSQILSDAIKIIKELDKSQ